MVLNLIAQCNAKLVGFDHIAHIHFPLLFLRIQKEIKKPLWDIDFSLFNVGTVNRRFV